MAMQQSSKGVSGTGSNPALSDEQADQFAASFTPAWDSEEGAGDITTTGTESAPPSGASTQVMDRAELLTAQEAAPPIVGTPAIIFNPKSTMIGLPLPATLGMQPSNAPAASAPPPAASSAEAIDPANVLEVVSAPAPVLVAEPAPAAAAAPAIHQNPAMRTQIMQNGPSGPGPLPSNAPAVPPHAAPGAPGAATIAARPLNERTAPAVPIADPFRNKGPSSDDLDFPKRSNKTLLVIVGGLAVAAGLGLFLKFAVGDDAPKTPPAEVVTGPAVTTAEIPPPPPPTEAPPPAATAKATEAVAPSPPLAAPPRAPEPQRAPVAVAPPHEARPRPAALPPPPASPPVAAQPKSAPKGANGGIVRDNPF